MLALLVDDDPVCQTVLQQIVGSMGFRSELATNGREAMDRLHLGYRPQLVFVDWDMPVMDGMEFLKQFRTCLDYAEIKVVMLTAKNEIDDVAEALALGADEYVMKPFSHEMIAEKLAILGLP